MKYLKRLWYAPLYYFMMGALIFMPNHPFHSTVSGLDDWIAGATQFTRESNIGMWACIVCVLQLIYIFY